MILETERLILRPWVEEDAESLFSYAKDPQVGPVAGWPVHTSVENSREVIKTILAVEGSFAITLKGSDKAIGSIGLTFGKKSNLDIVDNEAEIGYWIGVPFWGQGYVPEAVREIQRYAFEELHAPRLWCAYFDGNQKSKRVQEKCGFHYDHTEEGKFWAALQEEKTEHVTCLLKEEWEASVTQK